MKKLNDILHESILANDTELSNRQVVKPKSKDQLQEIIDDIISKNKPKKYSTIDLNFIDVSGLTDLSNLFSYCDEFVENYNFDVSEWDVSNVKYMNNMFQYLENFNCDLSKWKVNKVEDMSGMFSDCNKFEGKGLDSWKVDSLKKMDNMFKDCINLKDTISGWNVENVIQMQYPLLGVENKELIDNCIRKWCPYKRIYNLYTGKNI